MATLESTQIRIDAWMNAMLPFMVNDQASYLGSNGRYGQCLNSHSAPINHTTVADNDRVADQLNSKPTDQSDTWIQVINIVPTIVFPCVVAIDAYDGPAGHGYVIRAMMNFDGDDYQKAWNNGPESHKGHEWRLLGD